MDIFIGNLEKVSEDLQPLIEWAHSFHVSAESDDIRNVIQICQVTLYFAFGVVFIIIFCVKLSDIILCLHFKLKYFGV